MSILSTEAQVRKPKPKKTAFKNNNKESNCISKLA